MRRRIDPVEAIDETPDLRALANNLVRKNTKAVNGALIKVSLNKKHVHFADGYPRAANSHAKHTSSVVNLRTDEILSRWFPFGL